MRITRKYQKLGTLKSLFTALDPPDPDGYKPPPSRAGRLRKTPQKRCWEASLKSLRRATQAKSLSHPQVRTGNLPRPVFGFVHPWLAARAPKGKWECRQSISSFAS